jgi:hypothetical protein
VSHVIWFVFGHLHIIGDCFARAVNLDWARGNFPQFANFEIFIFLKMNETKFEFSREIDLLIYVNLCGTILQNICMEGTLKVLKF